MNDRPCGPVIRPTFHTSQSEVYHIATKQKPCFDGISVKTGCSDVGGLGDEGLEHSSDAMAETAVSSWGAAPALHAEHDPDLIRLLELWAMLMPDARASLLIYAEQLAEQPAKPPRWATRPR